jgi:demethylmenaquinone methyltransferase / 2-methoxy-6-polyprenyl-1,4-benzoquinol methylase
MKAAMEDSWCLPAWFRQPCAYSLADMSALSRTHEPMPHPCHEDAYVQELFDRMGPTYGLMNLVSSFGFSELWRRQCVRNAGVHPGVRVCDMMSGSGECWSYVLRRGGSLVSVDFSRAMSERQRARNRGHALGVDVRCENALQTSLNDDSIDCVVGAFGLKTLSGDQLGRFALEIHRVLKPGGRFSLLEISTAEGWFLAPLYRWYLRAIIPLFGKLCLGDIECYRMLAVYTDEFVSCERVVAVFAEAGLDVTFHRHVYGCATSLVGAKRASP